MKKLILVLLLVLFTSVAAEAADTTKPPSNLFPDSKSMNQVVQQYFVAISVDSALSGVAVGQKNSVLNQIAVKVGGNYASQVIGSFNALQLAKSGSLGTNILAQQFSFLSTSIPNPTSMISGLTSIPSQAISSVTSGLGSAVGSVTSIPSQAIGAVTGAISGTVSNAISSLTSNLNVAGISANQIAQIAGLMQTGNIVGAAQFVAQLTAPAISNFLSSNFGGLISQAQQIFGQAMAFYQKYLGYMNKYLAYINELANLPSKIINDLLNQVTGLVSGMIDKILGPIIEQVQKILDLALEAFSKFTELVSKLTGIVSEIVGQITQMLNSALNSIMGPLNSLLQMADISGILNGLSNMISSGINSLMSGISMSISNITGKLALSISGINFGDMPGMGNLFSGMSGSGSGGGGGSGIGGGNQGSGANSNQGLSPIMQGIDTSKLAKASVANALGLAYDSKNIVSIAPIYEDAITGLTPERTADAFCENGASSCKNLLPLCEDKIEKSKTGPITATKYSVGDCMKRASILAMASQLDFTAKVKKESVDKKYITSYKIENSAIVLNSWQNFYFKAMNVSAQRVVNMKCMNGILNKNDGTTSPLSIGKPSC